MKFFFIAIFVVLLVLAHAHGPALSPAELQRRDDAHLRARRAFGSCQPALIKRSFPGAHERREELIRRFQGQSRPRQQQKEKRQQPTTTSQRNIATGTNTASPFSGIPTCVMAPESVQGPYYLPGELIRPDMRESEPGVPLLLDLQVFDAKSCKVLPNVMIDFWHSNATGVYSGYEVEGTEGLTWLRGLAETDDEGVAQIASIFPGHYGGRAIHIHIMAHMNGQIRTDGDKRTYVGATNPFVGQLFFNMDLINEVEDVAPYTSNRNRLTDNSNDRIFNNANRAVDGYDGLMDVRKLGNSVEDGIVAWISVGIDTGRDHDTGFNDDAGGSRSTGSNTGMGSAIAAGKIAAWGMGAVVAAAAFFG